MSKEIENENKKNLDEIWGCNEVNPRACRLCRFAFGEPPFADMPEKAYCMIYDRNSGTGKPDDVYYNGADCEFFQKHEWLFGKEAQKNGSAL